MKSQTSTLFSRSTLPSKYPNDSRGQRFTKVLKKKYAEGGTLYVIIPKMKEEITDEEKKFWTRNDKTWAWNMFLTGARIETILEFVGGQTEEFHAWVSAVLKGETKVSFQADFDSSPNPVWTRRQEKILRRLRKNGMPLDESCRLLGRSSQSVRTKWAEIKNKD